MCTLKLSLHPPPPQSGYCGLRHWSTAQLKTDRINSITSSRLALSSSLLFPSLIIHPCQAKAATGHRALWYSGSECIAFMPRELRVMVRFVLSASLLQWRATLTGEFIWYLCGDSLESPPDESDESDCDDTSIPKGVGAVVRLKTCSNAMD